MLVLIMYKIQKKLQKMKKLQIQKRLQFNSKMNEKKIDKNEYRTDKHD